MLNCFWVAYKLTENRINQMIRKFFAHTRCTTIKKKTNQKRYTFVWMDTEHQEQQQKLQDIKLYLILT